MHLVVLVAGRLVCVFLFMMVVSNKADFRRLNWLVFQEKGPT